VTKERRLGRGLEALLGRMPVGEAAGTAVAEPGVEHAGDDMAAPGGFGPRIDPPHGPTLASFAGASLQGASTQPPESPHRLAIERIDSNPYQPRVEFDPAEINALAESLVAHGLLQPIVVRPAGERFQLIAGERRLRAATQAGWSDVPVQIIAADDREMAELAIVENLQRKDLNPLEKAASFHRYLEEYGCTQEELAGRLKIDRSTIANLIRLLELPSAVQQQLHQGKITQGHARALLPLGDDREQIAFCKRIQAEGLSVRQTEALVQQTIDAADGDADDEAPAAAGVDLPAGKANSRKRTSPQLAALEQEFRKALGLKVSLKQSQRGRGTLTIQFRDHEEFEQLREYLCGE